MKRLLIAGAGYLGQALAERLTAKGQTDIWMLRRSSAPSPFGKTLACDITDKSSVAKLPDVDAIFYAIAADGPTDEAYDRAYRLGVSHLIERYAKLRPHFYYASSTSVYAEASGALVREDGMRVDTGPSRFMVQGEDLLLQSGLPGALLRYGGLYGPTRTAFLRRIRQKEEALSAEGPVYTNRIHRDDAVAIVDFLLDRPGQAMEAINAVDANASDRNEVIRWVMQQYGMAEADYPQGERSGKSLHRGNKRVSSEKLQSLGFRYRYPSYREGYADLLAAVEPGS